MTFVDVMHYDGFLEYPLLNVEKFSDCRNPSNNDLFRESLKRLLFLGEDKNLEDGADGQFRDTDPTPSRDSISAMS